MSRAPVYVVLGAGLQGVAAAHDLAGPGGAHEVRLVDRDPGRLRAALDRLHRSRPGARFVALEAHLGDAAAVPALLTGADGMLSALPYDRNPAVMRAALEAGVHATDLGGQTERVKEVLALDEAARARGVSLVSDAGIAPGTCNVLAALAVARHPEVRHVRIHCGGLPKEPRPPLDYELVFSVEGLLNEYSGTCVVLRDGRRLEVPALEELEEREWPGLGRLEAFATSGASSLAPERFLGRLQTYEYKTLRYPGHCERMRLFRNLGFFREDPVATRRGPAAPRAVLESLLAEHLGPRRPDDLIALEVLASSDAGPVLAFRLFDPGEGREGFSAMERCTAFSAALGLAEQVAGRVSPGAGTPETMFDGERYLAGLAERGLHVEERRV